PVPFTPVEVLVEGEMEVAQVASEQRPFSPVDDVALEGEARVRLGARALDLGISPEGTDAVAHDILSPIVLVEPAVSGAVDEVVLDQDIAAALVEVDAPAAVAEPGDVVEGVGPNDRSRLDAEGVDAAHIAQDRAIAIRPDTDVVHLV